MPDCAVLPDLRPDHAPPGHATARADAVLAIVVADGDDVMFACESVQHAGRARCGERGGSGGLYVVVHRSLGVWTHVYRVVRDARSGRLAVFVERVIEGEQATAALDWAWVRFAGRASR